MSWLDDLGGFVGNLFGGNQMSAGQQNMQGAQTGLNQAMTNSQMLGSQAGEYGQGQRALQGQYVQGAQQSMGTNAADYLQKSQEAAQKVAGQQAQMASSQAATNAASAARASGVNAGQAGLGGGQQAANAYTQTFVPGQQAAMQQYAQGTQQFQNAGQNAAQNYLGSTNQQLGAAQLGASAAGTLGNLGQGQYQQGQGQQNSMIGGLLSAFGLEKGGEFEYAADGLNTTNAKAFPLLVESGERVQVSPTAPGGGVKLGKLWDEVKPYIIGAAGYKVKGAVDKPKIAAAEQAASTAQEQAKSAQQQYANSPELRALLEKAVFAAQSAAPAVSQYNKKKSRSANRKAKSEAENTVPADWQPGQATTPAEPMGGGEIPVPEMGTEGLDLTIPPDEKEMESEQKQGTDPMKIIGPILSTAAMVLPALLSKGGDVQVPKMGLGGSLSSAGQAELGGGGSQKQDPGTGEAGVAKILESLPAALDSGGTVNTPKSNFSSILTGSKPPSGAMNAQNYNFLKSPMGKALVSMGIIKPPVSTQMAGGAGDSASWGENPAAGKAQTLNVASAAEGGNMDVHPEGCRCEMCKGGTVKMSEGGDMKVHKVMKEFKEGELHSGSKQGPQVTNRKQAVAIAMSEAGKSNKAAGGIDFIVPPGHDKDTFPMQVLPGTHVKVTPKDKVKTMLLMELAKKGKKEAPKEEVIPETPQVGPQMPPEFMMMLNKLMGGK